MNARHKSADRALFYFYLALWVWLPLPLGSNRVWAVSVVEIAVFLLTTGWLVLYLRGKVRINDTFKMALLPVTLLFLFVFWVGFQTLLLPPDLLEAVSPAASQTYAEVYAVSGAELNDKALYNPLSMSPYHSGGKFIESLFYGLLFCLTLLLVNSHHRLKLLAIVIVCSGVFQAVYGCLMTLSGVEYAFFVEKTAHRNVATGTFLNRNHLAGYLEMSLAIGIGLLLSTLHQTAAGSWREMGRRLLDALLGSKIRLRVGLIIMVIAMVLTHSRMGNVAFFTSMTVMGGLYLLLVKKPPRSVIILFVSLMMIDVLIVGTWFGLEKVLHRLEKTEIILQDAPFQDSAAPSNVAQAGTVSTTRQTRNAVTHQTFQLLKESRDEVFRDTRNMLADFKWTGAGGGTFANSFLRYQNEPYYGFYDHTHNDYLEFLAEYGFLGSGLSGSVIVLAFINALIAIRKRRSALLKGLAFSSAMGIMAIMIHSTVDFNLQIPSNAALFVLLLALAWIVRYKRLSSHGKGTSGTD